jgi:hypothetical protein
MRACDGAGLEQFDVGAEFGEDCERGAVNLDAGVGANAERCGEIVHCVVGEWLRESVIYGLMTVMSIANFI